MKSRRREPGTVGTSPDLSELGSARRESWLCRSGLWAPDNWTSGPKGAAMELMVDEKCAATWAQRKAAVGDSRTMRVVASGDTD
jgi:hypothetical protein